MPLRLEIRGLRKAFGANVVLRELDLDLARGEIHALVGGNGAGKSTLSRIIAGLESLDAGEIRLDGKPYAPCSRRAAQEEGVVMVLQELNVLPTLTVAENLFLEALPSRRGLLDRHRLETDARAALSRVGLGRLDPSTPAAELGIGHQQLVEIAAGLTKPCRVLILDEPTAALSGAEIAPLFELLRRLRAQGQTVLYISHRLEELAEIADRVSVLRDGHVVATAHTREINRDQLIQHMAGRITERRPTRPRPQQGPCALRVRGLHAGPKVAGIDLEVRRGEIVGLGGLVGAGRTELLRAIFGADPRDAGEVLLDDQPLSPAATQEAVRRGMAYVPEDRKRHGILAGRSIRENAALVRPTGGSTIPGWIDLATEQADVRALVGRLQVEHVELEQPIVQLSGGNQQKVVMGRWLQREVRLWLLDEPTRGVDAGARQGIYDLLRTLAGGDAAAAVLLASSDYEELAELCDRVLVISNGRITAHFTRAELTPAAFTAAAFAGFRNPPRASSNP